MALKIPEELIIRLIEDQEIEIAGCLEAEMTFMKKYLKKENSDVVYCDPERIVSKRDIFLYGAAYGRHLEKLERGIVKVSPQVSEMFTLKSQN